MTIKIYYTKKNNDKSSGNFVLFADEKFSDNAFKKTPTANIPKIIFTDLSNFISYLIVFMFAPLFIYLKF